MKDRVETLKDRFGFLCTMSEFRLLACMIAVIAHTLRPAGCVCEPSLHYIDTVPDSTFESFVLGVLALRLADASFGRAIRQASESRARCRSAPL